MHFEINEINEINAELLQPFCLHHLLWEYNQHEHGADPHLQKDIPEKVSLLYNFLMSREFFFNPLK